ncbi:DUF6005 family protein [Cellvibrio sp. ARAG 10.3]|uniref:DUF6005 family protein n=1 Tax=Cellvibrio sp. ARAG 10.3 TaxID=3451358 RepID=UPI003F478945
MTKTDIVNVIHQVLAEKMAIPYVSAFSPYARLNEDLYLDSVMVLQLLLHMELDHGFVIPDEALAKEDFETVDTLANLLARLDNTTTVIEQPIEFEDIKVHCFVSCVCEMIKKSERVDHRPFYFGVWDADIVVTDDSRISYHSATINHDFFIEWYKRIYGVTIHRWYDSALSKEANVRRLLSLLDNKMPERNIMVMLDMYLLPERENKFNANPFPHYVMLETTDDPDAWLMLDPDYRWEGELPKARILEAIRSPHAVGGYYFDSTDIAPSSNAAIKAYFEACIKRDTNPMTDAVRLIIHNHLDSHQGLQLSHLAEALKELPVLSIRKYAYEHGFAFFWRAMKLEDDEFEAWCDVIGKLVETYKIIQYRAMKLAVTDDADLAREIFQLLDEQDQREFTIKQHLHAVYQTWCATWEKTSIGNTTLSPAEA